MHGSRERIQIVTFDDLEKKQHLRLRGLSRWQATLFTDVFLLRFPRHYTHFALVRDAATGEIRAGVGLRKEYIMLPHAGRVTLLQLGKPFGNWEDTNFKTLRNSLLHWCVRSRLEHLRMPLYCWTDARNEEEYRFMARFLPDLYPSRKNVTTRDVMQLIRQIGVRHFQDAFDPLAGAVQHWFYSGKIAHSELLVSFEEKIQSRIYRSDPQFFHERNPGYTRGDAMIVIAPLTLGNTAACFFTPARFSTSHAEIRESAVKKAAFR